MSDTNDRRVPPWLPGLPYGAYAVVLLALPLGVLAVYSFWTADFFDVTRTFTVANWREIVDTPPYASILLRTLGLAALAAVLCTTAGFVVAHAITFRLRRTGTALLLIVAGSLLASYLVRVYAWGTILGTNGVVNRALTGSGLVDQPLTFLFYGYFAIVVTLAYVYLPLAVLVIYGALQHVDRRTLEASRDMGAGRWSTLARVTLPQAAPGLSTAFRLTFVLCAADYVTPTLVGGAKGQMVGAIIRDQFGGGANIPRGAALAFATVIGILVVLGALTLVRRIGGRAFAAFGLTMGRLRAQTPFASPIGFRSLSVPVALAIVVFLLAPLAIVILFSFNKGAVPGLPLTGLTSHWYGDVVHREGFSAALGASLQVMGVAVAGGLVLGVPAAFALARAGRRTRTLLVPAVYGPIVFPGIVLGVALLTAFDYAGVATGIWPSAAAHVLLVTPFVILVVHSRLATLDLRLGEAARDLGAAPRRVLATITLPVLTSSLLGASLVAAATSLDEILVTNFTIGTDSTLPVWVFGQIRRGLTPGINALAVMILFITLGLALLAALALRRAPGRPPRTVVEMSP